MTEATMVRASDKNIAECESVLQWERDGGTKGREEVTMTYKRARSGAPPKPFKPHPSVEHAATMETVKVCKAYGLF